MRAIDKIEVEMSVILGRTSMPIQQLLRLGRGAVIMLDETANEDVEIVANNSCFGTGQILVKDQKICVEILKTGCDHGD